jgi:hypothetical protein
MATSGAKVSSSLRDGKYSLSVRSIRELILGLAS